LDFIREVREAFPTLAHLPDALLIGQPIDALFRLAREERAAEGKTSKNLEQRAHQNAVKAAALPAEVKAGLDNRGAILHQARRSLSNSCGMPPAQRGAQTA
jgi:predicted amidohydrolase